MTNDRMEKLRAERKRIRDLIHDYCFTEQSDRGCASCPVNEAGACSVNTNEEIPLEKLRKAEEIILRERRKV